MSKYPYTSSRLGGSSSSSSNQPSSSLSSTSHSTTTMKSKPIDFRYFDSYIPPLPPEIYDPHEYEEQTVMEKRYLRTLEMAKVMYDEDDMEKEREIMFNKPGPGWIDQQLKNSGIKLRERRSKSARVYFGIYDDTWDNDAIEDEFHTQLKFEMQKRKLIKPPTVPRQTKTEQQQQQDNDDDGEDNELYEMFQEWKKDHGYHC